MITNTPMVCVKLNPTRRLKDPIRPRSYIRKVRKTSPKIGNTPQPSTSPATGNWETKTTKADPAHGTIYKVDEAPSLDETSSRHTRTAMHTPCQLISL